MLHATYLLEVCIIFCLLSRNDAGGCCKLKYHSFHERDFSLHSALLSVKYDISSCSRITHTFTPPSYFTWLNFIPSLIFRYPTPLQNRSFFLFAFCFLCMLRVFIFLSYFYSLLFHCSWLFKWMSFCSFLFVEKYPTFLHKIT